MAAIWTFILEKILEPLGISVLTDATKGGARRIFCRKKIKKEERQREETHAGVMELREDVRDIKAMLAAEPSETIRKAAADLQPLIENLHVKTAHEILSNLRKDIKGEDRKTLARIDYYRGCCSRYVNKESCISEYDLAFQEMVDNSTYNGGVYDPDIVAGKVYVYCIKKEKDKCIQMAAKLKQIDRKNIWAWVPDLLFSENLEIAFNSLPEDIDRIAVLANSTQIGNNEKSLGVNIQTYEVQTLKSLTLENISLWLFNLSVLTNRYIPEWNAEGFMGDVAAGPACIEFNKLSSEFLTLVGKTELGDISPNVRLFNIITSYRIKKDVELLKKLHDCKSLKPFVVFKQLSYALFLAREEQYDEAKAYLNEPEILTDCGIYNLRFYLSVASADRDYALETLKLLVEKNVEMPGQMLVFLLVALLDHYDYLKEYADKVYVTGETNAKAYREILNSLRRDAVDVDFLIENELHIVFPMRPFVAVALNAAGKTQEALDLSESCLRDGCVDVSSSIYFSLLKQTRSYMRLDTFLRKMRECGFAENPTWLVEEYLLAQKEDDFNRMLEIAKALHRLDPNNSSYFVCLLLMQYQNGHFNKVKEMSKQLGGYKIREQEVDQVFNVLLLSDLVDEAVEFLYDSIRSLPFSEKLNLLFHEACMNPKAGAVIRKEYETVEYGLYVAYKHNGALLSDFIVEGQRTTCMIGKKVGDIVSAKDRMGKEETFEIVSIHNKFYKLLEDVYKDIHENKYQTAFSFTIDDLEPENLLGSLAKAAGHDERWLAAHNQMLDDYRNGKTTIINFFNGHEVVAEFYNHLFGDFKVYSVQIADFNMLYKQRGVDVEKLEFVLDLPTVIILYELHLKYGFDYPFPMIVSRGVVNLIEDSIARETHAMPAGIYQKVADMLAPITIKNGETWYLTRLQGLLKWIKEKTKVEVAHEMVELDTDTIFNKSRYLTLVFQSILLARQENRAFVSEDLAMILTMGNGMVVSDVNYLIYTFYREKYNTVVSFFMESNIYGCDLDLGYVLNQYEKHSAGDVSTFAQCRENLSCCPSLYQVVLNFCSYLYSKQFKTTADGLIADNLLTTLFKQLDRGVAIKLLNTSSRQFPHMKQELLIAFKIAHPIMW